MAIAGGWHGDVFVAVLRTLGDAPTFRLKLAAERSPSDHADVGFGGPEMWEGVPASQPAVDAHQSAVSP
jgi:hypothetical protein